MGVCVARSFAGSSCLVLGAMLCSVSRTRAVKWVAPNVGVLKAQLLLLSLIGSVKSRGKLPDGRRNATVVVCWVLKKLPIRGNKLVSILQKAGAKTVC